MNRRDRRKRERVERKAARAPAPAPPDARIERVEDTFDPDLAAAMKEVLGADVDGECRGLVVKIRL